MKLGFLIYRFQKYQPWQQHIVKIKLIQKEFYHHVQPIFKLGYLPQPNLRANIPKPFIAIPGSGKVLKLIGVTHKLISQPSQFPFVI